jgi:hypothetical protein
MLISIDGLIWSVLAANPFNANNKVVTSTYTNLHWSKKNLHKHKWYISLSSTLGDFKPVILDKRRQSKYSHDKLLLSLRPEKNVKDFSRYICI